MTKNLIQRGFQLTNIALSSHKIAAMPRDHNHLIAKRALADQFADARGAVMKIGQFLATPLSATQRLSKAYSAG